jgi:hypothetical protein
MNHKAGTQTQRLRANIIERDIDYSCVQYIYTTVYRASHKSQGGDTDVTNKRNRKRYRFLVCAVHFHNSRLYVQIPGDGPAVGYEDDPQVIKKIHGS